MQAAPDGGARGNTQPRQQGQVSTRSPTDNRNRKKEKKSNDMTMQTRESNVNATTRRSRQHEQQTPALAHHDGTVINGCCYAS